MLKTPAALAAAMNGDFTNAMIASTPGGIEAQEKAGQEALVASSMLPKEMARGCTREHLEQIGFKFGEDADELFVNAEFPEGWKLQAADHSMLSYLLDNKGRKRFEIFYKAAFYDRRASMTPRRRYNIDSYVYCDADGNIVQTNRPTHFLTAIKDCDEVIHSIGFRGKNEFASIHENAAIEWMKEHFPNWTDAFAYWD